MTEKLTRLGLQCRTPLRGKGQIGFGQVFFEFWSGFSLDFTLFGLEIIVGALPMAKIGANFIN